MMLNKNDVIELMVSLAAIDVHIDYIITDRIITDIVYVEMLKQEKHQPKDESGVRSQWNADKYEKSLINQITHNMYLEEKVVMILFKLNKLPNILKTVIAFKYLSSLNSVQICNFLDISIYKLNSLLNIAYNQLRLLLNEGDLIK